MATHENEKSWDIGMNALDADANARVEILESLLRTLRDDIVKGTWWADTSSMDKLDYDNFMDVSKCQLKMIDDALGTKCDE